MVPLVRVMYTWLVPNSISVRNKLLLGSKIGVGLTTKAGNMPALLPLTGMPVLLMPPQVVPLSPEVSGTRAAELAYCQTRKSVVEAPSGEPGGGSETRMDPAVRIDRKSVV